MAAAGSTNAGTIFQKLGLKPITKCSLVKFYVPAFGVTSYTALSVNVMNPSLVIRIFPKKDITNFLLGSALVGTGSYIYTREHMKKAPTSVRIAYSTAGAVLLSFGSVLVWAVLRSVIPPNPTLCTLAGIGSGLALIKVGSSYLNFVDEQTQKK
ncbi:PREDICTED: uncharacterized protein LOC107188865 [Dufourea novaeangliae]|uniref:Uncharacterized protein n=1 Tax=Dufourea novaeangliae TaxID=178035 RepID=A0A154PHD2_DUFNO|nr:PREDICTED: uncharacterized protein LOC107188865 [Dufourea novaeangliae]KZC10728.1 hypothetical protein WN55_02216 [Dufourea novaeangliae]